MDQGSFYDDIAEYYDLIFPDWDESMKRQGDAISRILDRDPAETRILDVSAGIGTQALPLASIGYEVVARDLSPGATGRLRREAERRGLRMDVAVSDMRDVSRSTEGSFDAVISLDNSVPHLLTDAEIVSAFRGMSGLMAPEGIILISVRDYDAVDRSPTSIHSYGERVRGDRRFRMRQEWEWYDESHYRTMMIVEESRRAGWEEVVRTAAAYYAIPISRLLELMGEAGLKAARVEDAEFYQPVLRGRAG